MDLSTLALLSGCCDPAKSPQSPTSSLRDALWLSRLERKREEAREEREEEVRRKSREWRSSKEESDGEKRGERTRWAERHKEIIKRKV